jgi:hypothetical protein
MAKNGFRAFDSDMHVFEPADLYTKYMSPKWGERIPVGKPRNKHGMTRYFSRCWQADPAAARHG